MSHPHASSSRVKHSAHPHHTITKRKKYYDPNLPIVMEKPEHMERWANLVQGPRRKVVVSSLSIHPPTLDRFYLTDEVIGTLEGTSMMVEAVFFGDTYNKLVEEFISTFEPRWSSDRQRVVGWRYRMQNIDFAWRAEDICSHYGFSMNGFLPNYSKQERVAFWTEITGLPFYHEDCTSRSIMVPKWKYIHRLVAININSRRDEGSRVSIEDLNLLKAISVGAPIDWLTVFTNRFLLMQKPNTRNRALGCAAFITNLAKSERFQFECESDASRSLDYTRMWKMEMIDHKTGHWVYKPDAPRGRPRHDSFWEEERTTREGNEEHVQEENQEGGGEEASHWGMVPHVGSPKGPGDVEDCPIELTDSDEDYI